MLGAAAVLDSAAPGLMSPAEAAQKPKAKETVEKLNGKEAYDAARRLISTTRMHNGVHAVNVFHEGRIVPLGELNTEGPRLVEERQVDSVLASLGFTDANAFADAFNAKFSHRTPTDQARLQKDAEYVANMRQTRKDIKIRNPEFINVRLALMIWVGNDRLIHDHSKTFDLAGQSYNTPEVQRVVPTLTKDQIPRLLLDHEAGSILQAVMELSKKRIQIPDLKRPTVTTIANFLKVVGETKTGDYDDVLQDMLGLYYSTTSHAEGTGEKFLYDQFRVAPMGKAFDGFLKFLRSIQLERNGYNDPGAATTDAFSKALEKLDEDDENFRLINRFLPSYGN